MYTSVWFGLLGVEDAKGAGNRIMSFQEKAPSEGDTVNNLNILYSASASAAEKKINAETRFSLYSIRAQSYSGCARYDGRLLLESDLVE
jgi:hypothetical protein